MGPDLGAAEGAFSNCQLLFKPAKQPALARGWTLSP